MPTVGNFSAWIQVDHQLLPEYAVKVTSVGSKVTCWVPSEAGKHFEICYSDSQRLFSTRTRIWVDGVRSTGKILHARHDPRGTRYSGTATHRGLSLSDTTHRPYIFADCELVEDEDFVSTLAPGVGEIKCVVEEVQAYGYRPRHVGAVDLPPLRMQERAKKGIVHGTKLGHVVQRRAKATRETRPLRKLVSFTFKYRPLAVLVADGNAPSSQLPGSGARPPRKRQEVIDLTIDKVDNYEVTTVKREPKKERSITYDNDVIDLT